MSALPGVEAAGISDYLPLGPNREWDSPVPKGKVFSPGELPAPLVYVITPGFIRALGIRMHGRDFTWADGPESESVVLINASAARVYWPGEDAVGKILIAGQKENRVVGVVDDVHEETVEGGTGSQIYYPAMQQIPSGGQLVVRTSLPPASLAASLLRALRDESQATVRRVPPDPDNRRSCRLATTLFHAPCCRIRLPWVAARRPRHLRRNLVFSHATSASDRHSHGTRRKHRPCAAAGTHRHAAAGVCRYGRGHIRFSSSGPLDFFAAVCDSVLGSADLSGDGAGAFTCCSYLRLHSCAPRFWHQPDGGSAQQLTCRVD